MKRPQTYKDWKWIYQGCIASIGYACFVRWGCRDLPFGGTCNGYSISIDRGLWRLIDRCSRIRKRLDVEHEVKDKSWCDEMLKMLMSEFTP